MHSLRTAFIALAVAGWSTAASAGQRVVLLGFGGDPGDVSRAVARGLSSRYELVSAARLTAEARRRGHSLRTATGRGLAARALRVAAIVSGTVTRTGSQWLVRAVVYSGNTGQTVGSISFPLARPRVDAVSARRLVASLSSAVGRARPGPPVVAVARRSRAQPLRRVQVSRRALPRPVEAQRDEPESEAEPPPAEPPRRQTTATAPPRVEPDEFDSGSSEEAAPEEAENLFDVDEGRAKSTKTVDATARFTKRKKEDPRAWEKGIEVSAGLMLVSRSFDFNDPVQPQSPNNYRSGMVPALLAEAAIYPLVFIGRGPLANLGVTGSYYRVLSLKSQPPGATASSSTTLHQFEAGLLYRWNILGRVTSPTLKVGASVGRLGFAIHWDQSTPPSQYTLPDIAYLYLKLALLQLEMPFYHSPRFSIGGTVKFDYIHCFSAGAIESSDPGGFGKSTTLGIDIGGGLWATFSGFSIRVNGFYRRIGLAFDQGCVNQGTGCYQAGGALDVYGGLTFLGGYAF